MDFMLSAALAGISVALIAGPLGSFVVWRRMAYYSDSLSHAALLGVALGLFLNTQIYPAVIVVCLLLALVILLLESHTRLSVDSILGIIAPGSLALGVITVSLSQDIQVDLMAYLFGDLLAVTKADIITVFAVTGVVGAILITQWRRLLAMTVHEELAIVEGIPVGGLKLLLLMLIAISVAVAMKIVGVLLISALLVVPSSTARQFSASPEAMAVWASLLGCLSVLAGLAVSWYWDTPAGPSIVVCCVTLFILSLLRPQRIWTRPL